MATNRDKLVIIQFFGGNGSAVLFIDIVNKFNRGWATTIKQNFNAIKSYC